MKMDKEVCMPVFDFNSDIEPSGKKGSFTYPVSVPVDGLPFVRLHVTGQIAYEITDPMRNNAVGARIPQTLYLALKEVFQKGVPGADPREIPAHEADLFWIEEAPKQSRMFGVKLEQEPAPPSIHLHEGNFVTFGNTKLEVIHVPGHSPGSIVFYCAADNCLFSGDVLFQGSIGRADLAGGNFDTLIEGICEKLFVLPDETIVYPGHGAPTSIGIEKTENPFFRI